MMWTRCDNIAHKFNFYIDVLQEEKYGILPILLLKQVQFSYCANKTRRGIPSVIGTVLELDLKH